MGALNELLERLDRRRRTGQRRSEYAVPGLWVGRKGAARRRVRVDPIRWLSDVIGRIEAEPGAPRPTGRAGDWTRDAVVYNVLIRTAAAFDHNGNGRIDLDAVDGWRETGTFAKAIALLPYVRDLGCNTVHLLPITAIGDDGRKGILGSPYAVRNPYRLDPSQAEPGLGLGVDVEFAAFVEAAHRLGLRVVQEFVLRTAAKDSDWVAEHPEWFYWVLGEEALGSPRFSDEQVKRIKEQVSRGGLVDLPPPPSTYRARFVHPRLLEAVARDGDRWIGRMRDGSIARIPGAFSDWPPDDAQPPWSDVTYLRMYDHPDFDYMAYNTLRMYDERLARREHAVEPLWSRIVDIIPHYRQQYGIDGALVDMGHALPHELMAQVVETARRIDPDFAFWAEDFRLSEEAKAEGYNAVIGNYWWAAHRPASLRDEFLHRLSRRGTPLPFFAAPETHNTPRCAARSGGVGRSRLAWILGCFLPAVPFVHAGFEFGETAPVNTGLDFSPDELANASPERLALYGPASLAWCERHGIASAIRLALAVRRDHLDRVKEGTAGSLSIPAVSDERTVAYVRSRGAAAILVVGRFGGERNDPVRIESPFEGDVVVDLLTGDHHRVTDGRIVLRLRPWDVAVLVDAVGRDGDAAAR